MDLDWSTVTSSGVGGGGGGDVERLSMWPAQMSEGKGPALPKQHLPLWPIWTGQGGGRV